MRKNSRYLFVKIHCRLWYSVSHRLFTKYLDRPAETNFGNNTKNRYTVPDIY